MRVGCTEVGTIGGGGGGDGRGDGGAWEEVGAGAGAEKGTVLWWWAEVGCVVEVCDAVVDVDVDADDVTDREWSSVATAEGMAGIGGAPDAAELNDAIDDVDTTTGALLCSIVVLVDVPAMRESYNGSLGLEPMTVVAVVDCVWETIVSAWAIVAPVRHFEDAGNDDDHEYNCAFIFSANNNPFSSIDCWTLFSIALSIVPRKIDVRKLTKVLWCVSLWNLISSLSIWHRARGADRNGWVACSRNDMSISTPLPLVTQSQWPSSLNFGNDFRLK
jgi:hypothetical protein